MKRRKWDGSWDGGRFRDTMDGPSYWIEKMVGGRRYAHPLGNVNEARAKAEYALFLQSPLTYVPPAKRIALDAHAKAESEAKAKAGAVVITTEVIEACVKAARAGTYGRPKSEKHIKEIFRYLGEWALGPLAGRDLRHVSLAELNLGLDRWPTARRKRIVVLKSFTKFLRQRSQLTSQNDPTRDLVCPQPAPPSEAAKAKKVYTPEQLAEFYRHLDRDDVRDVFLVRALTGLHFTEIERIAKGEGVIRAIGKGEIAATVSVKHKSGVTHVQSLDKRTHKALERIVKRGRVPDPRAFIEAGRRAPIGPVCAIAPSACTAVPSSKSAPRYPDAICLLLSRIR